MSLKNLLLGGLYVCVCICMCIYVIYTHIYTLVYTHIYTYIYMLSTSYGHYKLETVGKVLGYQ